MVMTTSSFLMTFSNRLRLLSVPALSQDEAAMTLCIFNDTRNAKGEFDFVNGFCNIFF